MTKKNARSLWVNLPQVSFSLGGFPISRRTAPRLLRNRLTWDGRAAGLLTADKVRPRRPLNAEAQSTIPSSRLLLRESARPTIQGKTDEPSFGCNQRLRVNASGWTIIQRSLRRFDPVRTRTSCPGQPHLSPLKNIPVRYHRTSTLSFSPGGAGNQTDHHRQPSYYLGAPSPLLGTLWQFI